MHPSPLHRTRLALLLAALALVSLAPAPWAPAGGARADHCQPFETDVSTGGDVTVPAQDPVGAMDNQWTLVAAPSAVPTPANVYAITKHPAWVQEGPASRWVNPWDQAHPGNAGPGGTPAAPTSITAAGVAYETPYVYQVRFFVDFATVDVVELDMAYAADDVSTVYLNGGSGGSLYAFNGVTSFGGFAAWHQVVYAESVTAPVRLVNGWNTLEVEVHNWILYTGLLLEGVVRGRCLEDPCKDYQTTAALDTGAPGVPGQPDALWYLTLVGGTPQTTPFPHPVAVLPNSAWVLPPPGTSWVSPTISATLGPGASPSGAYEYNVDFLLRCIPHECERARLSFDYAADNDVWFSLNGAAITGTVANAFGSLHHVDHVGCKGLRVGVNTLTAHVQEYGVVTGLLVDGTFSVV